jgi:hypothetical protein
MAKNKTAGMLACWHAGNLVGETHRAAKDPHFALLVGGRQPGCPLLVADRTLFRRLFHRVSLLVGGRQPDCPLLVADHSNLRFKSLCKLLVGN